MPVQTLIASSTPTRPRQQQQEETLPPTPPRPLRTPPKTSNLAGLPLHIQKQLLQDIEEAGGGIAGFKLQHLCNRRPAIYGNKSSDRRRQVQNKFHQWKTLDQTGYYHLLSSFGVQPARNGSLEESNEEAEPLLEDPTPAPTPPARQHQLPPQTPPPTRRMSSTPMTSVSVNSSFTGGMPMSGSSLSASFLGGVSIDYGESMRVSSLFLFLCLLTAFLLLPPPPDKVDVIEVDINCPERNREVKVVQFRDAEIDGILHNGFEIIMEGDLRDLMLDKYSAKLVSDNEILISMPSASHYWLHEPELYFNKCKAFNIHCPRAREAHDVARNDILADEERQIRSLLLRFPENTILSNRHYSPKTTDNDLEFEVVPFQTTFVLLGKQFTTTVATIVWKIAVFEEKRRVVVAQSSKGKKGEAKLASRFASMSVGVDMP
jgi:hypothetical protein